jgi:hypothetical protein
MTNSSSPTPEVSMAEIMRGTLAPPVTVQEPWEQIAERIRKRVQRENPNALIIPFVKRKTGGDA